MPFFLLFIFAFFSFIKFALADYQTVLIETMTSSQGVTIKESSTSNFGGTTAGLAGDFNGDGIDDFLIADCYKFGELGWVYVIFGRTEGLEDPVVPSSFSAPQGFVIKGPTGLSRFGNVISSLGDVNGDGIDDIIVAAVRVSQIYVIYGRRGEAKDISITSDFPSSGQGLLFHSSDINMGSVPTLNGAGDVNGDGIGDILIGIKSTGVVYVIYGMKTPPTAAIELSTTLDPAQGFRIVGPGTGTAFGTQVSPAGDLNGDKIDDFLVGAVGTVYIFYGKLGTQTGFSVNSAVDFDVISGSSGSSFGSPLSISGDINHDGFVDMVVGASGQGGGTSYIISGSQNGFSGITLTASGRVSEITASQSTTNCFRALGIGDFSGDGLADVAVRCVSSSSGETVYVIFGSLLGVPTGTLPDGLDSGYAISSQDSSIRLGVLGSGDFNDDHLEDILLLVNQGGQMYSSVSIIYGTNGCLTKNCSQCSSSTVCVACFGGLGLYKSECVNCPKGTFMSAPYCVGKKMASGEILILDLDCPKGCTECQSETICSSCTTGYLLLNSQCVSKGKSLQENITGAALDGTTMLGSSVSVGSSLPTNFGLVAKILRNTRYLNMTVSDELNEVFVSWKISSGFIDYPESWGAESNAGSLPAVFERYNVGGLFLLNYWKSLVMILIGVGLCAILKLLGIIQCSKMGKLGAILMVLNNIASNFTLTQLYGSLDDIIFYFVLQVRGGPSETSFQKKSFAVSIFLMISATLAFFIHLWIIRKYQLWKRNQKNSQQQDFLQKYENCKMLFQDFKDSSYLKQSFLIIYIGRSTLTGLLITNLFEYPLLQTILQTSLNILIFLYLIIYKPFKESLNMWGQYFCETVLLVVNVSMLGMAFIDEMTEESQRARNLFSKLVIISNMVLVVGSLLFMVLSMIKTLYVAYKMRKSGPEKKQQQEIIKLKPQRRMINESFDQSSSFDQLNLSKSQVMTDYKITHFGVRNNSQLLQDDSSSIPITFQKFPPVRSPPQKLTAAKSGHRLPNIFIYDDQNQQQQEVFENKMNSTGKEQKSPSRRRQNSISKRSSQKNSPSLSQNDANKTNFRSKRSFRNSHIQQGGGSPGRASPKRNEKISNVKTSENNSEPLKISKFNARDRIQQRFFEMKINQEIIMPDIEEQPKRSEQPRKEDSQNLPANVSHLERSPMRGLDQELDYEKFLRRKVNESSAAYLKQKWLQKKF